MKTQLLEDIEDSGALPLRPRPAVWQRRALDAGRAGPRTQDLRSDPDPAGPAPAASAAPPSTAAAEPAPSAAAARPAAPSREPGPGPAPAAMAQPDWLADILRQDAELAAASRRPAAWLPRVLVWGVAACVLGLLAAGGLWLFEERQADGALTVMAEASPAPAASVPRAMPSAALAPVSVPAGQPPATATPAIVQPVPAVPAAASTGQAAEAEAGEPAAAPVVRRERAPAKAAASSKAKSGPGVSRQRQREETLVQCQAHGYDEQQCVQRGCALTRYGLACRG